ncbi:MAG: MBL fold metallo-hydrolase [archaeon]
MIKQIFHDVWKLYYDNFGSNCYLVKAEGKHILIDTSGRENREELISDLKDLNLNLEDISLVLLTHLHYDHIGNLDLFRNAEFFASKQEIEDFEKNQFDAVLNENFIEKIVEGKSSTKPTKEFAELGKVKINPVEDLKFESMEIIKVPGHTQGSIAFYMPSERILFSGDTLFEEGTGRTDLPTSNAKEMENSLKKLDKLRFRFLCAGH